MKPFQYDQIIAAMRDAFPKKLEQYHVEFHTLNGYEYAGELLGKVGDCVQIEDDYGHRQFVLLEQIEAIIFKDLDVEEEEDGED